MTLSDENSGPNLSGPRIVAIVQGRLGSIRMPGKVLQPILGVPALTRLLQRLQRSAQISDLVVAIPDSKENDELQDFCISSNVPIFRGNETDVLDRYYQAALTSKADYIVRITADCPMIDPGVIDNLIDIMLTQDLDHIYTGDSFPDGFDVEILKFYLLEDAWRNSVDKYDREHVTPYIRRLSDVRRMVVECSSDQTSCRVTLDEPEDLIVIESVFGSFADDYFSLSDVIDLRLAKPEIFSPNKHLARNEGAIMGTGEKLWHRAKKVIPGGNMLLSKRTEQHLQKGWPSYFSRAKGCRVWDLDDNEYIDAGIFGIGTNILGFGHPKVDEAVMRVVQAGNMSTLNCPEEVYLAEKLVAMHPWSGMARFTRSGGEACAVAVRIARAHSGKTAVAFCGYHGWHDWYLSANLSEDSALDGHLLPGLLPAGVPRGLAGTARPFEYNDLAALQTIMDTDDVGVIFMEVRRGSEPNPGFLEGVRAIADKKKAVLIFDECTSGFRKTFGGLHLDYGVNPDITVLGKTLGNGYAINAVLGTTQVMQAAQETFISSTFWTERIGPSAALATLAVMEEEDAPARIHQIGLNVKDLWISIGQAAGLKIVTAGVPSIGTFSIEEFDSIVSKTYVTQEMLKRGFIAGNSLYASIEHTPDVLEQYGSNLLEVFTCISKSGGTKELRGLLDNGPAQSGFQRLA
jgi:glutamate-1-semialdehyde 2,1-aminomutase